MAADVLVTYRARESAAMILTYLNFSQIQSPHIKG